MTSSNRDRCPDVATLETLLGDEHPPEWLMEHLELCDSCSDELVRLNDAEMAEWQSAPPNDFPEDDDMREFKERLYAAGPSGVAVSVSVAAPPDHIDEFTIVREIGRGGMGTVYEAVQGDPHRKVALKIIRPDRMSDRYRARFIYEAQILGDLGHPGIANVIRAGTCKSDGAELPYIAMEFIDGPRLTEYVRDEKLDDNGRIRLIIQAGEAMEYAHRNGVIHRDLTPSNILVAAGDAVKIIDFGVAHDTRTDPHLETRIATQISEIVGKTTYIAPEHFVQGSKNPDTRCDVYSLGVVGFELLSNGQLPYDIHGKSSVEIIRIVSEREPRRLDQIDRRFKGELTTIFGKALAKLPDERYASMAAFVEDLRRYLNNEPILARQPSFSVRVTKFCRRKPLVASLGAAVTMLVLVLATVGPALWLKASAAQQRAETGLEESRLAHQRADARFDESRELLDYLSNLSGTKLAGRQGVNDVRTEILEKVLDYYKKYVVEEKERTDPADLADAQFQVAYLSASLGRLAEASEAYADAISTLKGLLGRSDESPVRLKLAHSYSNLSNVQNSQQQRSAARDSLSLARDQWRRLQDRDPSNLDYAAELAANTARQGLLSKLDGKYADALTAYQEAERLFNQILARQPSNRRAHEGLISLCLNQAKILDATGRYAEAVPVLKRALALNEERTSEPNAAQMGGVQFDEAAIYSVLGVVLRHSNERSEANAMIRKAIDIERDLVSGFPGDAQFRESLARDLHNLALDLEWQQGGAADVLDEAISQRRALVRMQPNNLSWQSDLANSLVSAGELELKAQNADGAKTAYLEAIDIFLRVAEHSPQVTSVRRRLRRAKIKLAQMLLDSGEPAAAETAFSSAAEHDRQLAGKSVTQTDRWSTAAISHGTARALAASGKGAEAVAHYKTAAEVWRALDDPEADVQAARALAGCVLFVPADEAKRYKDQAMDAIQRALDRGFGDAKGLSDDPELSPIRDLPQFQKLVSPVEDAENNGDTS